MNRVFSVVCLILAFVFGRTPIPTNDDGSYFLYRPLLAARPGALPRDQGPIGTCVAVGHAGGVDVAEGIRYTLGKIRKLPPPASADSIYGGARSEAFGEPSRSWGDGANGYAAAKLWLKQIGGVLYQQPYDNVDLSLYDVKRCKDWGYWGNGGKSDGIGGPLDKEAAKTPMAGVALVKSLEELDVALSHGWPVTICSGVGFNSPRDKDGFCAPRGSWSHCMLIIGKRNEGRKGYLIQNSWGAYIKGDGLNSPNKYKDQPDGSFYAEPSVVLRILRAEDSWALSFDGFQASERLPKWFFDPSATSFPIARYHDSYEEAVKENAGQRPLVVVLSAGGTHVSQAIDMVVRDQMLDRDADVVFVDSDARPDLKRHYGVDGEAHVFVHDGDKNLHFGENARSFQDIGESL